MKCTNTRRGEFGVEKYEITGLNYLPQWNFYEVEEGEKFFSKNFGGFSKMPSAQPKTACAVKYTWLLSIITWFTDLSDKKNKRGEIKEEQT